jgi:hypothetical protein
MPKSGDIIGSNGITGGHLPCDDEKADLSKHAIVKGAFGGS